MKAPVNTIRLTHKHQIRCKSSLTLLLLFISFLSISQTDFRPGYYITWENDTIYGLVDYRGEIRNSAFCEFKKTQKAETQRFSAYEIQAYRFIDSKYYVSKKVKTGDEEKQVFLEFLVNGITNLYYYAEINNPVYFIEDRNGNLIELSNTTKDEFIEGRGLVRRQDFRYIGVLKATFADCMEIQPDIENIKLEHKSLIKLSKEYHDLVCDGEQCIIYEKQLPVMQIKIAPLAGMSTSFLSFEERQFSHFNFNQNFAPLIGLVFNITMPRFNEKLSIELESNISYPKYFGSYIENTQYVNDYYQAQINIYNLQNSASLKYTFPRGKIKPTFAVGYSSNIFLSKDQCIIKESKLDNKIYTFISDSTPLDSSVFGFHIQFGCNYVLLKKHNAFTNLKLIYLAKNNTGIVSYLPSANITFGMYLSSNK